MTFASDDLSATMRDYLTEIYRLSNRSATTRDRYVSTSALADLLDISAPAVNRMVTRLKELGLLEHERYQGIRLTESGEREALKELRRHRIVEMFLINVMGFQWHEVHAEANRMSTSLSDTLADRMWEMADRPTHCPHGEPIPNANGEVTLPNDMLLSSATAQDENQLQHITRVLTREPDRLEYMAALGLVPGAALSIVHIAPFNGPMQLKVGEEYRIIGHNLAELICIQAAD